MPSSSFKECCTCDSKCSKVEDDISPSCPHAPSDQAQRDEALNLSKSFLVQAPAGSGKTSLLTQRYLALLTTVKNPEEVVAITFSRKAAAEMRQRILDALETASTHSTAENQNTTAANVRTNELAVKVLSASETYAWQLLDYPHRLRIQTIDSLCSRITKQTPFAFDVDASVADKIVEGHDVYEHYRMAMQAMFEDFEDEIMSLPQCGQMENLLLHLDNNSERFKSLGINMLAHRAQWLPYLVDIKQCPQSEQKLFLEASLINLVSEKIQECEKVFPAALKKEVQSLLEFAAANGLPCDANFFCADTSDTNATGICCWQQMASIFLTNDDTWRREPNKKHGFPAASGIKDKTQKALCQLMKERFQDVVTELSHIPQMQHYLSEIKSLPPATYSDDEWEILFALVELLPLMAAYLDVVFHANNVIDHIGIALHADRILGSSIAPTELALNLDYKIKHILVDEFQDISLPQYRLLEKLTAGFEEGDGRTLFLVGDAMQSIYRFRQAEVGLLLRSMQEGIGNIKLENLTLTTNFRANSNLVEWCNLHFAKIFPQFADISCGGTPFIAAQAAPSNSFYDDESSSNVTVKFLTVSATNKDKDKDADSKEVAAKISKKLHQAEAENMLETLRDLIAKDPQGSIAILVNARSHLTEFIPVLQKAKLPYCAVEFETLKDSIIIQDLLALTRALTNLADRLAWLSILRAPWCGLTLSDLHAVATTEDGKTIFDNLCALEACSKGQLLSEDGKLRLARFLSVIKHGIDNYHRSDLRPLIENTWLALGGPACIENKDELEHAARFFDLLEKCPRDKVIFDSTFLERKLENLYISHGQQEAQIQILTIHKAKGLEFDHVIVSGLDRKTQSDAHKLLLWLERPCLHKGSDLLLAPIKAVGAKESEVYNYLKSIERKKAFYESVRLLYVAATRAKKTLHLFAAVSSEQDLTRKSSHNSLLQRLLLHADSEWIKPVEIALPEVGSGEESGTEENGADSSADTENLPLLCKRLATTWYLPL